MDHGPVLIAYDGSPHARAAVAAAGATLRPGPAVVATAWTSFADAAPRVLLREGVQDVVGDLDSAAREEAEDLAAEGAELARAAGLEAEPRAVRARGPYFQALVDAADEIGARTIVMGSRGRSALASAVLGSVSTGVLHHARKPVLVVRDDA